MNNNNDNIGCLYSWPVIIIALACFWPAGIVLIIKRLSLDKQTAMGSGKLIRGLGIGAICIAVLGFFVCISDGFDSSSVMVILFFGVAGYFLLKLSKKTRKEAEDIKQYLSIIVNGNVRQLDVIASSVNKKYDVVRNDIKKMIDKGYLKNAYINEGARELVFATPAVPPQAAAPQVASTRTVASPAPAQPRIVTCSCCGANNTIVGSIGECEYCGAPLK